MGRLPSADDFAVLWLDFPVLRAKVFSFMV